MIEASFLIEITCNHFNVKAGEFLNKTKETRIVHARYVAIYLLAKYSDLNIPDIADLLDMTYDGILKAKTISYTLLRQKDTVGSKNDFIMNIYNTEQLIPKQHRIPILSNKYKTLTNGKTM